MSFKLSTPKDEIDKSIAAFLTNKTGKFGHYVATQNALVFRNIISDGHGGYALKQNIVALRLGSEKQALYIGNSSVLPLIGRRSTWGNERLNNGVTDVQTRLSRHVQMIPFSVFADAGLDLTKIKILDKGPESAVTRTETSYNSKTRKEVKKDVQVHFTGASLFEVEDKQFLFDLDRREIKHKIFNPFLVELQSKVTTINEAYDSLKPNEVKDAEKAGLKVRRQGEWFFIPVKGEFTPVMGRQRFFGDDSGKLREMPLELRAGENRPNQAAKHAIVGDLTVVSGKVTHSGREHADLILDGWHKAVPNTSVKSFTLRGDID